MHKLNLPNQENCIARTDVKVTVSHPLLEAKTCNNHKSEGLSTNSNKTID